MVLIIALGILLLGGTAAALLLSGKDWTVWDPRQPSEDGLSAPDVGFRRPALAGLRGIAIGMVAGVWTGALITGPAMRLIMRLLAVTGGAEAQGVLTEADQVVGSISLDGTLGLLVFGGVLPGILSGLLYVLFRRWLPGGRVGGLIFGLMHLLIAATRVDPLRSNNVDFDIVGPGWLAVTTFGLAAVLHGFAIASFANRYSAELPARPGRAGRITAFAPLALPLLILIPGGPLVVPLTAGLIITILAWQIPPLVTALKSTRVLLAGRILGLAVIVGLSPPAIVDLVNIATH